jgi:beta-xylosidase
MDSQFLRRHVERTRSLMHKAGMEVPLYVTEWNCTISSRNYLNDTCYKGTYLMKNIAENLGKADVLAYWAGSDLIGTYYDSRNILNGCPGLLTKDSICKSAYYAFRFLSRMGPWLVETGENYLITTSGHFSYYIICWNYHPLNYRYYQKQEHEHTVKDILALSQHNPSVRMRFLLENLPEDSYVIKTSVVSPHYGSVLDEWVRLNAMTNIRQEDIDYLKRICTPHMSIQEAESRDGQLPFELELEAEQISLIHIYHKY